MSHDLLPVRMDVTLAPHPDTHKHEKVKSARGPTVQIKAASICTHAPLVPTFAYSKKKKKKNPPPRRLCVRCMWCQCVAGGFRGVVVVAVVGLWLDDSGSVVCHMCNVCSDWH